MSPAGAKTNGSAARKTRDRILAAADELFGRVGFDATTTREIAERSEVNKALIHYHFGNKEGLLESVLDRYYEKLAQTLVGALQSADDLRSRMGALVDAYVDFLAANKNFHRIVQREASGGRHMARIHAHTVPLFEMGIGLLEQTHPSTRTGDMAAGQLLMSFYGMVISYFSYSEILGQLLDSDPLSEANLALRKQHLRRMIDLTIGHIEAREGEGGPT